MKLIRRHYKLVALAAACIALGAGVSAITSAGAATRASSASTPAAGAIGRHHRRALARRILGGAVHGDLVVPYKSGFVTVTFDRGVVQSTSGNQLTITERSKKAPYKTVTLTIPATAQVRDNGHKANPGPVDGRAACDGRRDAIANLRGGPHAAQLGTPRWFSSG